MYSNSKKRRNGSRRTSLRMTKATGLEMLLSLMSLRCLLAKLRLPR